MGRKRERKWLSGLRLRIFARLFPLFALLVIAICTVIFFFCLEHHRQDMTYLFGKVARIHADELVKPLLQDDRAAVKKMLNVLIPHDLIEHVFVEKGGKVYAHVPEGRLPIGQPGPGGLLAGTLSVKEFQDKSGTVFYDIASPIAGTDATLHFCSRVTQ